MSLVDRHGRELVPVTPSGQKAATGLGVISMTYNPPLESLRNTPQEMMKKFLKAYKVGWFYKAESAISFDVSNLEISLKDEAGNEIEVPPKEKRWESLNPIEQLRRLLDRPNKDVSWREFIEKSIIRYDLAGNAFWYYDEIDEIDGTFTGVYNISPVRMYPAKKGIKVIGWVVDYDERGGGTPFSLEEIEHLSAGSADDEVFGVGVVESVLYEWEVNQLLPKHVADVLTLGGRLAGMVSPKDRSLGEDEFQDTLRAWRQIATSGDAAKRLLVFPEPIEWTRGAATPQEIGLPGINELNRTNILSAFPISEFRLGVPQESGLNSGDTRKHMFREHWEFSIHPRVAMLNQKIQHGWVDKFAERAGEVLTFEIKEPNRDDAPTLLEKSAAFRALMNLGFDPESIIPAVGLEHIKWDPALLEEMIMQAFLGATEAGGQEGSASQVPGLGSDSHINRQQRNNAGNTQSQNNATKPVRLPNPLLAGDVGQRIFVNDSNRKDNVTVSQSVTTQRKAATMSGDGRDILPGVTRKATRALKGFLAEQQQRIIGNIRETWPTRKPARKAYPEQEWWNDALEDAELRDAIEEFVNNAALAALTNVSNSLDRILTNDLATKALNQSWDYTLQDVNTINQTTKETIQDALRTAAQRGYSVKQVIDGVKAENYAGIQSILLDNDQAVWGDWRAEVIARTEMGKAYNRSNLLGYAELGVTHVRAKDGDFDAVCRARDGQPFSIQEALLIHDHPNGTLDWVPMARDFQLGV